MLLNPKRPRIAPLEPPYSAEAAAALAPLGPPISLFRVWARRPELARGIAGWGRYYLSRQSALSLRHRELVIDRTTALCGADYEWGVHVSAFAVKAGLTGPQVRSLGSGRPEDPCWDDPADRAVLRAVDELHASSDLTDEGWDWPGRRGRRRRGPGPAAAVRLVPRDLVHRPGTSAAHGARHRPGPGFKVPRCIRLTKPMRSQ